MYLLGPPGMEGDINYSLKEYGSAQNSRISRPKFSDKHDGWLSILDCKVTQGGLPCSVSHHQGAATGRDTGKRGVLRAHPYSWRRTGSPLPTRKESKGLPASHSVHALRVTAVLAETCCTHLRRIWVCGHSFSFGSCGSSRGFDNSCCGIKKSCFPEVEG